MGLATIDSGSQKEHTEIHKVLIRLVLTEIQRFKNVKVYKEMYGIRTPCQIPKFGVNQASFD